MGAGGSTGSKIYASGAGHVERPLITARLADGSVRMVVPQLAAGERADLSGWVAHGMRASATGTLDFSGLEVGAAEMIGEPGDYLRQPIFSAGAWRFAAVHLGGIERLLDELRGHLVRTRRDADPYQLARVGQAAMAAETAQLWLERAAVSPRIRRPSPTRRWLMSIWRGSRWSGPRSTCSSMTHRSIGLAGYLRNSPGRAAEPRSRHLSASAGARPGPGPGRSPRAGVARARAELWGAHDPCRRLSARWRAVADLELADLTPGRGLVVVAPHRTTKASAAAA